MPARSFASDAYTRVVHPQDVDIRLNIMKKEGQNMSLDKKIPKVLMHRVGFVRSSTIQTLLNLLNW